VGLVASYLATSSVTHAHQQETTFQPSWTNPYFRKLPFVDNAINRYALKNRVSVAKILKGRNIEVMRFPLKTCVQLTFSGRSVGGVPIYCYAHDASGKPDPRRLVEEYSDGE
jgi:hypothetical protein